MFQKTATSVTEEQIQKYIKHAGFKNPTLLQQKVIPLALQGRDMVVETQKGDGRIGAFLVSLLLKLKRDKKGIKAIILTADKPEVMNTYRQYRRFSVRSNDRPVLTELGCEDNIRKELKHLSRKPDIIVGTAERIIDHLRRDNITLNQVQHAIIVTPEQTEHSAFNRDVHFIYSKMPGKLQTVVYAASLSGIDEVSKILKRPQILSRSVWKKQEEEEPVTEEKNSMNDTIKSTANLQERIRDLLKIIKEVENPTVLDEYRRVFRKNVPLHLRAYFTAYLLKEGSILPAGGKQQTLFVSIGKNRKVYPKDLSKLFAETLKISSSQIGPIKILDSYSFIDIPDSHADRAIKDLNNSEYRGRRITVNHARKKDES